MRVKVSVPGKQDEVLNVEGEFDLETFHAIILSAYDGDLSLRGIRYGFPPQSVNFEGNEHKTLEELGISSGERIVVNLEGGLPREGKQEKSADEILQTDPMSNDSFNGSSDRVKLDSNRYLQLHEVPDDNSCLFHAISYAIYKDISLSPELRMIASTEIANDPITYSDAILGKSNREYSQWIIRSSSWGGGIEIAVLSKHLKYAIFVLDVDACKFEKFNEDRYDKFIIIAYNGVHYDTIEIVNGNEKQTVFDCRQKDTHFILKQTEVIAKRMKREGKSFNTRRDTILCNTCGTTLVGEREVSKHAERTGHVDFRQK